MIITAGFQWDFDDSMGDYRDKRMQQVEINPEKSQGHWPLDIFR